jgi:hypothetical protein
MNFKSLLIPLLSSLFIVTSCNRSSSGPTAETSHQNSSTTASADTLLPVARICSTPMPKGFSSAESKLQSTKIPLTAKLDVFHSAQQIRREEVRSETVQLALLRPYIWRDANNQVRHELRVKFLSGDGDVQQRIKKVVGIWSSIVNVKFDFVDNGDADIRIGINNDGFSWSKVGSDASEVSEGETMHYGWLDRATPDAEYQRTVLHEFGHALGAVHEHQSPGGEIKWNVAAVHAWCASNNPPWSTEDCDSNIINRYAASEAIFTRLDPSSIMVYSFPSSWTTDGTSMPMNWRLSNDDKSLMSSIYGPAPQR